MGKRKPRSSANAVDATMNLYNKWFSHYFDYLYGLTINSIVWENLPLTILPSLLEQSCTDKGYVLFFQDDALGFLALPCTIGGQLNVNRIPINRVAYSPTGYNIPRTIDNSVIIFNNYQHTSDVLTIELYASQLASIRMSTWANLNNQKFPLLLLTSPQQRLTMQNFYMQYDGCVPAIFGTKDFDLESIKALPMQVPFVADKLEDSLHRIMNDFLTWLGVENSNQDKKERMVANEVGSNYGNVELSRNTRLSARKYACDEINTMFGLDIDCHFNSDLNTLLNFPQLNEGEVYEQVYNTSSLDSRAQHAGIRRDDNEQD